MLDFKKLNEINLTPNEFISLYNGCHCDVLDTAQESKLVREYRNKYKGYGHYCDCVSNLGYLLEGTKLHKGFIELVDQSSMPCSTMQTYIREYLDLKNKGLMETE